VDYCAGFVAGGSGIAGTFSCSGEFAEGAFDDQSLFAVELG